MANELETIILKAKEIYETCIAQGWHLPGTFGAIKVNAEDILGNAYALTRPSNGPTTSIGIEINADCDEAIIKLDRLIAKLKEVKKLKQELFL